MKKYMIFAAVAALTLASCAKVETKPSTLEDESIPIGFSNYTPRSITKAGDTYVAGTELVTGKHFAVYAWRTDYGTFLGENPGDPDFMDGVDVTYAGDTSDGKNNTYSPIKYWPSGETPKNLSFVAYYPYGAAGITAPTFASGVGTYSFTAQSTAATMVDFCVSEVVNDQTYGNTNKGVSYKQTVNLPFHHQLTKVQFKFKKSTGLGDNIVVELLDAKLLGIKNAGTLTASFTQNTNPGVNNIGTTATAWTGQTGAQTYEIFVNKVNPEYVADPLSITNPVLLSESVTAVANSDIFLMVPQNMADDTQLLSVTWRIREYNNAANAETNDGVTGLVSEDIGHKTLEFKDDLVMETWDDDDDPMTPEVPRSKNWVKNQFVTYTATVGPKPILFTGDVTIWAPEQNGYFDVQ